MPFTSFSNCNSDSTGEQQKTCADHPDVCPNANDLKDVHPIAIWGEGKGGTVDLEVESIIAVNCGDDAVVGGNEIVVEGRNLRHRLLSRRKTQAVCSESSYYRIDGGQCAQICLGSKVGFCPTSMVTSMGKLTGGTCGKLGYAAAGKTMVKGAGPCGRLEFDLFEKSTVVVQG